MIKTVLITQRLKTQQVHVCASLTNQKVKHEDEDRPMKPDVNTHSPLISLLKHMHCVLSEMSEHFCSRTKYSSECLLQWDLSLH